MNEHLKSRSLYPVYTIPWNSVNESKRRITHVKDDRTTEVNVYCILTSSYAFIERWLILTYQPINLSQRIKLDVKALLHKLVVTQLYKPH